MAQKTGYRGYNAKRVADVETNIALGSRYLKLVLDGTGHPVLALAAYNAGPTRARRWIPPKPMEAAVFIETIPFNETRDYVREVQ